MRDKPEFIPAPRERPEEDAPARLVPVLQRELNDRRRYHRVTVPLVVSIGGVNYPTADWSLGGFRVDVFKGAQGTGADLEGTIVLPYADFQVALPMRFRIVRRAGTSIGCAFDRLGSITRRALRHRLEAAMEGRLSTVDDTLAVLSAPISSEPLEDLLQEEDDTHFQIGSVRLVRKLHFYVALGFATLLAIGALVYRNAAFIDIPDATVMGNFVSIASRGDGRLAEIFVHEGQSVEQGEALFEIENPEITSQIALAEARVATAQARYTALTGLVAEEAERRTFLSDVSRARADRARANLRRVEASLAQARLELTRRERLVLQGVVPKEDLDAAVEALRVFEEERAALQNELRVAELNTGAAAEGRFFGGQEIEGRTAELDLEARVAVAEVEEAQAELASQVERLAELRVAAPVAGKVYTLYRHVGEVLRPRDVVASIQAEGDQWVVGRLRSDEVIRVRPGMEAQIVVPSYDLRARGVLSAVGHQGLSTASQSSPDMESSLNEVPIKVLLPDSRLEVPPGVRARVRIRMWDLFGWFRSPKNALVGESATQSASPPAVAVTVPVEEMPPPEESVDTAVSEPGMVDPGLDAPMGNLGMTESVPSDVSDSESTAQSDSAAEAGAEISSAWRVAGVSSCLVLRRAPTRTSPREGCLFPGAEVLVQERQQGWGRVRLLDGRVGWLSFDFLVPASP